MENRTIEIPEIARTLIDGFTAAARSAFAGQLAGVYVHGSAVMGCYNPSVSDLDFIVVVDAPITDAQRRDFMEAVAALDAKCPGKGIEMSVVTRAACSPFVYPTPFELHWSRMHAAWYARDPEDYIAKMRGTDADLAAHFTVIRARGACMFGAPAGDVFAPVPGEAYVDSIFGDVSGAAEEICENGMYLTLNLARVLAYLEDGAVLSKREGGAWALDRLPGVYRPLIQSALDEYGGSTDVSFDPDLARRYAAYMLERIATRRDGEL